MKTVVFLIFLWMAVMSSFNAGAIAVASDYLENSTLTLVDGASALYGIRLQNPSPEEIHLKLTYDDSIAKIVDYQEGYAVPAKSSFAIFFNISAPNAKPGDVFDVGYTVHEVSASGAGIPLLLKINKNFKVKIVEAPDKSYTDKFHISYAWLAVGIIALAFFIFISRKKIAGYFRGNKKGKVIKWKR